MTTKSLMKYVASQLPKQGISLNWDIRGEIGNENVDENKTLIAVCHCANQSEIIYNNFTFKLDCALTGQILLNALTTDKIEEEVNALYDAIATYTKNLKYTDCNGPVVMQGTCGALSVDVDSLYYTFSVPFTLYTQF